MPSERLLNSKLIVLFGGCMDFSLANNVVKSIACIARADNGLIQAEKGAAAKYGEGSVPARILKSLVLGTDEIDGDVRSAWLAFINLTRSASLIGKIAAVRRIGKITPRTKILIQNELPLASWTKEGMAIAPVHTGFNFAQLSPLKAGTELIFTKEFLNLEGADFESQFSNNLTKAIGSLESLTFVDPDNAGVSEISPPSVTNGVEPIPSSGSGAEAVRTDLLSLFTAFEGDLENAVFCMHPWTCLKLCLMQASLGEHGLTVNGGFLFGIPVVTSRDIPIDSTGTMVVLLDAGQILLVDEGLNISKGEHGTVSVANDEGEPGVISLWQENLAALQVVRYINWEVAGDNAVVWLSGVEW